MGGVVTVARSDVPGPPVRVDELDDAAARLRSRAGVVGPAAEEVVSEWRALPGPYDTADAVDLVERMTSLGAGGSQTSEAFSWVGEVLSELAEALRLCEKRRSVVVDEHALTDRAVASPRADFDVAVARVHSDIDGALDAACRDLAALAAPPPLRLAAGVGAGPLIGPRITWSMRSEQAAADAVLAPLVEAARGGAGRVRKVLVDHPEWAERISGRRVAPSAVRDWWVALPPGTAAALIEGAPAVIGALGGVPPLARVAANSVVARERIPAVEREIARFEAVMSEGAMATLQAERRSALDRLRAERSYLDRVVAGDVQLVLYQPDENRIVEMIGTPGPGTRRVLTYVPGTFTSVDGFYRGEVQELPQWLVRQDQGTLAFVWKGTEFPGDDERTGIVNQMAGINEANDQNRAGPAGEALARFVSEMRSDPRIAASRHIAGGYSWGLVPVTSSEVAGVRYDSVHSFAGAWVPVGWKANGATEYYHWSYTDFLSIAQDLGWVGDGRNPDVMPGFERHIFERPGDYEVPLGGDLAPFLGPNGPSVRISLSPLGNHQLITESSEDNAPVLNRLSKEMSK